MVLAFWRDLFVALTLLPALAVIRPGLLKVKRADMRYLVIYGLVLAIFNALWTLSVALERRGYFHCPGLLFGRIYCLAGLVVPQRTPGLG